MIEEDLSGRSLLLRNVLIGWVSQLLLVVTGFFLPRVIDQELGQTTVGIWDFAWSLVSYLNLTQLGVASSLSRFISNYRSTGDASGVRMATSTVTAIQIFLSAAIVVLVAGFHGYIPVLFESGEQDQVEIAQATFFILGTSIAIQFLFDTSRGVLTGCHRWDIYNGLYSSAQIIAVCLMVAAILLGQGLVTISLIYLAAITLECVARTFIAARICPEASFIPRTISVAFLREIFMFGVKTFTMNMGPLIVIQTVSVMIASTLGPATLAVFSRPNSLVRFIQTFVTRFAFVLTPMAGPIQLEDGDEGLRSFAAECSKFGFAFAFPVLILFCVYGDEVIRVWMGDGYVNQPLVIILGMGFLLPFSLAPLVRVIVGLDYHGPAALLSMLLSLLSLLVGALAVFRSEPSLSAFALIVAGSMTLTSGIAIPLYACRRLSLNPLSFAVTAFGRVFAICLGPFALMAMLEWRIGFEGLDIIPSCTVFIALVATGYWFFLLNAAQRSIVLDRIGVRSG